MRRSSSAEGWRQWCPRHSRWLRASWSRWCASCDRSPHDARDATRMTTRPAHPRVGPQIAARPERSLGYNAWPGGNARMRTSVVTFVIALSLFAVAPAHAQGHAAPQSALDAALERHVSSAVADRQDVQRVLGNPQVKALAQQMGLDVQDASRAVATLDSQELSRIATQARQVDQALA